MTLDPHRPTDPDDDRDPSAPPDAPTERLEPLEPIVDPAAAEAPGVEPTAAPDDPALPDDATVEWDAATAAAAAGGDAAPDATAEHRAAGSPEDVPPPLIPTTAELEALDASEAVAPVPARAPDATRDPELDALRDGAFPVVWRGYDVQEVDAYVDRVRRAVDRFEEQTKPTAAVQRALDRVGEQTAAILREAEHTAEQITAASRARADDRLQRAEREAAELRAAAEARVRALDDDIERLWQERQRLIDATKDIADQLRAAADGAEARFPPEAPAPGADESPAPGEEDQPAGA